MTWSPTANCSIGTSPLGVEIRGPFREAGSTATGGHIIDHVRSAPETLLGLLLGQIVDLFEALFRLFFGEVAGSLEALLAFFFLCAAEVIASAISDYASALPEKAQAWLTENASLDLSSLVDLAKTKLERVLAENSELHELWQDDPATASQQREAVARLQERLRH